MLSYLTFAVSIGLGNADDVLGCIGIRGFEARLIFWILLPAALALLVAIGSFLIEAARRCKLASYRQIVERALPLILRIFFLLYPLVSNVAFEAFSCCALIPFVPLPPHAY